jgi:hypothetical protein
MRDVIGIVVRYHKSRVHLARLKWRKGTHIMKIVHRRLERHKLEIVVL